MVKRSNLKAGLKQTMSGRKVFSANGSIPRISKPSIPKEYDKEVYLDMLGARR